MKNNQSGRSMVEMLAVLAIIGVLSVTGIMAYNYAMVKHLANELVYKANLAYVDVMTHDTLENWSGLKITGFDGVALQGLIYKEAGFVLIENVDKDVCENILNDKTNFSLMTIDNESFTTCDAKNSMVFDFANAGDIGLKCISGHCPLEDEGQYCSKNTGTCVMKTGCTNETLWSYKTDACDTCEGLNGDSVPVFKDNDCISCGENDETKPVWDAKNKKCVNCLTEADCEITSYCNNNTCTPCPANSSTVKTDEQIESTACYCNSGYVLSNGICITQLEYKCTDGFIITTNDTHEKYCVSNTFETSYENHEKFCTDRGMNLVEFDTLCPNKPGYPGTCPNLKNVTTKTAPIGYWALSATTYNDIYKRTVLIGPGFNHYGKQYTAGDAGYHAEASDNKYSLCQ